LYAGGPVAIRGDPGVGQGDACLAGVPVLTTLDESAADEVDLSVFTRDPIAGLP
jgi:hypothetical protein